MSAPPRPDGAAPTGRVVIRSLVPADADRVGALTLAGYDRYGRIDGPYRDHLGDPRRRIDRCTAVLVAELDGEVVGTVTFVLPGDEEWEGRAEPAGDAGFRMLAVDPRLEGRGVGRALVAACIDLARRHRRRRVVIVTMAWMDRAQRLYAGLGFVRRPDLDVRFPSGVGYVLTLDLTADADRHFPAPRAVPDPLPWFTEVWA